MTIRSASDQSRKLAVISSSFHTYILKIKAMVRIIFLYLSICIICTACGSVQSKEAAADSILMPVSAVEIEKAENIYRGRFKLDRFESEITAFEDKDKVSRYEDDQVLFVGSSSIRLWKTLAEDMEPYPVLNRGFGGSTLPEVNHYFDRIVAKYKPAQIFIYCGENDIAEGLSADQAFSEYVNFVGLVNKELPGTDIFFIAMKPSPARWELWDQYRDANEKVKNLSSLSANLFYIDITEVMLDKNGEPDESIFIEDMLHMNSSGYDRWEGDIKPYVKAIRDRMKK